MCSHAAMALPLLDLARRRAGNAWAGKVYRVGLCTHRACRASVARAMALMCTGAYYI